MKKSIYLVLTALVLGALLLAACGGGGSDNNGNQGSDKTTRPDPPAEYAGKTNPVKGDANAAAAGKTIYDTNCTSCHGATGKGDGPAGASLDPKPQDLSKTATEASDAYIYWRIAEGGGMAPFNSAMPAWKDVLTEEQIWQVVTHIQTFK